MRYSFDPVDFHRGDTEISVIADRIGVSHAAVQTWRKRGMSERNADRCATALGLHPHQLWPEMLAVGAAEVMRECANPECYEDFIVTRSDKRYCSVLCGKRNPEARARKAEGARRRYAENAEHRAAKRAAAAVYQQEAKRSIRLTRNRRRALKRDEINAYKREWRARKRAA